MKQGFLKRLKKNYNLTMRLTVSKLKSEHRNKVLGNVWALLNPLLFMMVYYVIFGLLVFRGGRSTDFLSYLFVGIIVYRFFSMTVQSSAGAIKGNTGIITASSFPRVILPITVVLTKLYDFALMLLTLFIMLLILKTPFTRFLLFLPLIIAINIVFVYGCALIMSWIGVFFEDISDILSIIMRILFYFSPIIYPIDLIPKKYFGYFCLNPITVLLIGYRDCLLYGKYPNFSQLFYLFLASVVLVFIGTHIYRSRQGILERNL